MKTRELGRSPLRLTTVGLGTWAIGGGDWKFGWGPQDDEASLRTIHEAVALGVNWIDTAPVYGLGHSETIVGRALRGIGNRPFISTKCERCWDESGNITPRLKRASIRQECEDSLRRLGVEAIDLYQIHWPQPDEDIEEGWLAIGELIREGKVRYAGVSNFSAAQLRRIHPLHPVTFIQPPYSMLARGLEAEILPYCQEHGIGIIAYSPMQKGLLTGKVRTDWAVKAAANDHRHGDPQFNEPLLSRNIELAQGLGEIAHRYGRNAAELAIAWVLRQPQVTAAIVGARKPGQLRETVGGGELVIKPEDLARIEALLAKRTA